MTEPNFFFQEWNPINGVLYKMQCPKCGKWMVIAVDSTRTCDCPRIWKLELDLSSDPGIEPPTLTAKTYRWTSN